MTTEWVTLKGGVALPVGAIMLAIDLESRGIKLSVAPDNVLLASPGSRLTADDLEAIKRHRSALKAIVRYANRIEVA